MIGTSTILAHYISHLRVSLERLATWVVCKNTTGWCVTLPTGRGCYQLDTNPLFMIQSANIKATAEEPFLVCLWKRLKMHKYRYSILVT